MGLSLNTEIHYLVWSSVKNSNDIVVGTFNNTNTDKPKQSAKKLFNKIVSEGATHVRYEAVEVIGGNEVDCFIYGNSETKEIFSEED